MRCVYFMQAGEAGPIKVGYTYGAIAKRLRVVKTGCPWPVRVLGAVEGNQRHEAWVHQRFGDLRLSGEWFSPEPDLLDFIREALSPGFKWPTLIIAPIATRVYKVGATGTIAGLLDDLGGTRLVAADLHRPIGTVSAWKTRDRIQLEYWPEVIALAEAKGVAGVDANCLLEMNLRAKGAHQREVA